MVLDRIVQAFRRLLGREEEKPEEEAEAEVEETRKEMVSRIAEITAKKFSVEDIVEEAKKDLGAALDRVADYFGLSRMVIYDEDGKMIGVTGGPVNEKLVKAAFMVKESLDNVDNIMVFSEESKNYSVIFVDDYIVVCESDAALTDADVFMLQTDIGKVISASVEAGAEIDVPYLVADMAGFLVDSNMENADHLAAIMIDLMRKSREYFEGDLIWIKATTDLGKTLAMRVEGDVLIAFVVEADPETVDEKCEEVFQIIKRNFEESGLLPREGTSEGEGTSELETTEAG